MRRSQTWKKAITYGDQAQWLVRMERCTFLEGNSYPSIEDAYAFYVHNRFYLITTDHLNHFYTSNNGHYENAGIVLWQSDDPHAFPVDQVVPAVKTISNYIDVTALSELKQYRGIKFERPSS